MLRQDPVECLLSFICSSNNHVARITAMIERLCQAFGRRLCQLDARPFHAFPSLAALAGPLPFLDRPPPAQFGVPVPRPRCPLAGGDAEAKLRALGFGYRAKYVSGSARAIAEGLGAEGLCRLRAEPYAEARRVLCALPGVGTKVGAGTGTRMGTWGGGGGNDGGARGRWPTACA